MVTLEKKIRNIIARKKYACFTFDLRKIQTIKSKIERIFKI